MPFERKLLSIWELSIVELIEFEKKLAQLPDCTTDEEFDAFIEKSGIYAYETKWGRRYAPNQQCEIDAFYDPDDL